MRIWSIIEIHIFQLQTNSGMYGQGNLVPNCFTCFTVLFYSFCCQLLLLITLHIQRIVIEHLPCWGIWKMVVNNNKCLFPAIYSVIEFTSKHIFQVWSNVFGVRDWKGKICKLCWVFLETVQLYLRLIPLICRTKQTWLWLVYHSDVFFHCSPC